MYFMLDVCEGRINVEIGYRRPNVQLQDIITLLLLLVVVISSRYFYNQ